MANTAAQVQARTHYETRAARRERQIWVETEPGSGVFYPVKLQ